MSKVNPDNKCAQLYKTYEYRDDALSYMFDIQKDLQVFMHENRGTLNPNISPSKEKIDESLYYWSCTCTEFFEMMEALGRKDFDISSCTQDELLEIQYELIDMWHFIMNQFIYIDRKIQWQFSDLEDVVSFYIEETFGTLFEKPWRLEDNISRIWKDFSYTWSEIMQNLPYKHWKTYKKTDFKYNEDLIDALTYEAITIFIALSRVLGIDSKKFYNLYCSKNQENIDRQKDVTKGYK